MLKYIKKETLKSEMTLIRNQLNLSTKPKQIEPKFVVFFHLKATHLLMCCRLMDRR